MRWNRLTLFTGDRHLAGPLRHFMNQDLEKKLNLRKDIVLDVSKKMDLADQKAQVVLCLDFSGSMARLYQDGSVQALVERILPLGLAFDDNGEVDFYLFENGYTKLDESITLGNVEGYIDHKILRSTLQMGGTQYAPVVEAIVNDFAHVENRGGFMGIGSKKTYGKMDLPVFVIFITDGDNSDHHSTEAVMREASNAGIFFQFVGIGDASFSFLKRLDTLSGRQVDNANFFSASNLNSKTDDELYGLLLKEFPAFIKAAKAKDMIK